MYIIASSHLSRGLILRFLKAETILWREKDELKQVVSALKAALSGRRSVIKGKHLLTTVETL